MSGLYDSYVVLDQRATMLVGCGTALSSARSTADALARTVATALSDVMASQVATPEMGAVRTEAIKALDAERTRVDAARIALARIALPAVYASTTVEALGALQAQLVEVERMMSTAGASADASFARFQLALGADEQLVAARTGLRSTIQALDAASPVLRQWRPDLLERLSADVLSADQRIAELVGSGDVAGIAEGVGNVASQATVLASEVAAAVHAAAEREAQHARRDYLVRSLTAVCAELGFERLEAPAVTAADEVALRYDTIDRGVIDFRIGLDNRIHTDSAIEEVYCAEQFDVLGDALAEAYGLDAKFTGLQESDDRPRSRTHEAAQEPTYDSRSRSPHGGTE